ncbi:hypothetical protein LIER_34354 [Lithospermum erythrorhizon]|uniref:C2H2-type domain-containing protein n=1 Tax=Lithospermum erythrorhizon TaxID=34254 RepID=A0AAV3S3K1_LITER
MSRMFPPKGSSSPPPNPPRRELEGKPTGSGSDTVGDDGSNRHPIRYCEWEPCSSTTFFRERLSKEVERLLDEIEEEGSLEGSGGRRCSTVGAVEIEVASQNRLSSGGRPDGTIAIHRLGSKGIHTRMLEEKITGVMISPLGILMDLNKKKNNDTQKETGEVYDQNLVTAYGGLAKDKVFGVGSSSGTAALLVDDPVVVPRPLPTVDVMKARNRPISKELATVKESIKGWEFSYGEPTNISHQSPLCGKLYCDRFVGPDGQDPHTSSLHAASTTASTGDPEVHPHPAAASAPAPASGDPVPASGDSVPASGDSVPDPATPDDITRLNMEFSVDVQRVVKVRRRDGIGFTFFVLHLAWVGRGYGVGTHFCSPVGVGMASEPLV